jgi:hypothetical protein
MEDVLKILLEVENLTADQRAQVQDGLTSIQSDVTETPPNDDLDSETLSDLSALISIRYRHQSEEEASAVRIARARTGSQVQHEPHRPPASSTQDSERRELAKKINSIIKASAAVSVGESTGLNRRARWNMPMAKLAAGSTGADAATGNTANAQAAARKAAQAVCFLLRT